MKNWIIIVIVLIILPICGKGQEREWLLNKDSIFTSISSEHFKLYSYEGHLNKKTKLDILKEREAVYQEIADFFEIKPNLKINIFLFENEQLKYNVTGHKGLGWGFDTNIVEVFNESFQMDPYHEMVHVLGYTVNKPPALIDEGTAVYLSQSYGENAFSRLIHCPTKSINEILLEQNRIHGLLNISTLLAYDEIGNSDQFILEYCTAASFVEFLIEEFGKQKFLELYKSLSNKSTARNKRIFEKIYGLDNIEIENEWIKYKRIKP